MPTPTLAELDALPRFAVAIENPRAILTDADRRSCPPFELGAYEHPFYGWLPLVSTCRLWWWN